MESHSLLAQPIAEGLHKIQLQSRMRVPDPGRIVGFTVVAFAEDPQVIQIGFLVEAKPLVRIEVGVSDCRRVRRMMVHNVAAILVF